MEPAILPGVEIDTLSDALTYAIQMGEVATIMNALLDAVPQASAIWLSGEGKSMLSIMPLPDPTTGLVEHVDGFTGLEQVITWRFVEDASSGALLSPFLDRRDALEAKGVTLVDEIVVSNDGQHIASLAVRTFSDRQGWDDVSARYNVTLDEVTRLLVEAIQGALEPLDDETVTIIEAQATELAPEDYDEDDWSGEDE